MRCHAVPACRGLKQRREKALEEWLDYWRFCETKSQEVIQLRKSNSVTSWNPMTSSLAHSLARASVITPEPLKITVVWDLYWLLLAQHNSKAVAYWHRWYALHRRRAELRRLQAGTFKASKSTDEQNDFVVAPHVDKMSLRLVNATIFLMTLQPPSFQITPGKHFKVQDLVRLANGNLKLDLTEFGNVPWSELRRIPPTVSPFMSSPLCDDPGWIRQRCLRLIPIIPSSGEGSRFSSRGSSEWFLQRQPHGQGDHPSMSSRSRMPPLCLTQRQISHCTPTPSQVSCSIRSSSTSPKSVLPELQGGFSRRFSRRSPSPSMSSSRNVVGEPAERGSLPLQKPPAGSLPSLPSFEAHAT
eukprot:GGOE01058591.1.p1 GENE.GGOE01058591.1~~GGOE01058591.1.p1  ORF type:complete len:356 (-),score=31.19 GGOE01058591.1:1454-2521(-)